MRVHPYANYFWYSPIRSCRYTVAMLPFTIQNVLKYRTRQNVGGISMLVFNTKCTRECRPHFALWLARVFHAVF
jgi:hypothetical protein